MIKLVFATNNQNKFNEIASLLNNNIELVSLSDIGCTEELLETSNTLEGNALQKAMYVFNKFKLNCFADDTGLEVEALEGRPGVYSARYAGEQRNAEDNMNKLLEELKEKSNKSAAFRTVLALVVNREQLFFDGSVKGNITDKRVGDKGFGYDPVFIPEGYSQTFAQMDMALKNKLSHRGIAVGKLAVYLNNL